MIEDLLDSARIEAGIFELHLEDFDFRDVIEDVVRTYAPTSQKHRILSVVPEKAVYGRADRLRVEQVVTNLLSNAIKYSPDGGDITVALRAHGKKLTLVVSDRGMGIPDEALRSIFLPFQRRNTHVAGGAGLGLSVVRRIVEALSGTVSVESTPGSGSSFTVRLPVGAAQCADAGNGSRNEPQRASPHDHEH